MTDEQHSADAETQAVNSPGTQLREARERAGWTIETLAAELCLPAERLRALEADDHESFGGVVYVRGYLRRAAALLDLPAESLIAAYESCCDAPQPTDILPGLLPGRPPSRGVPGWAAPLSGVVAAAVALAFTWWTLAPGGSDTAGVEAEAPAETPPALEFLANEEPPQAEQQDDAAIDRPLSTKIAVAGDAPAQGTARNTISNPDSNSGSDRASTPDSGRDAVPNPLAEQPQDAALATARVVEIPEAQVPPPGTVELRFEFTEDCWLEVEDAQEKRLAYRLYRAGDVARLRGTAPVSVFLGNAAGTRLSVDGSPIAVRPAARRDGTARLTVGGGEG